MNEMIVQPNLKEFTDQMYVDVVGQDGPKRAMKAFLDYYLIKRHIPNTMFLGQRGNGKTKMARETGKGLYQFDELGQIVMEPHPMTPAIMRPKRKKFHEINCSTIKGVDAFTNLLIGKVVDKDVTIFFDEASEIPLDVAMMLLTILQPNQIQTQFVTKENMVLDFDFTRQTFLFATTESHKVFHALMHRLEKIVLQEYSVAELAEILRRTLSKQGITCPDEVLMSAASVARGTARGVEAIAEKMNIRLCGRTEFTLDDWKHMCYTHSIRPLGLNNSEISVMRYLAGHIDGTPLTNLAAKLGMTREALQRDVELELKKNDLIEVSTTGRVLTPTGMEYLKQLDRVSPVVA